MINVCEEIDILINKISFVIKRENISKSIRKLALRRYVFNLSEIIFAIIKNIFKSKKLN